MFPGLTTKVSEQIIALTGTISPKTDAVHVTDTSSTTVVATITPPYGGFSGVMFLVNRSGGNVTTTTTGNILAVTTVPNNLVCTFIYSKLLGKWCSAAIS